MEKRVSKTKKKLVLLPLLAAFLFCALAWSEEVPPQHAVETNKPDTGAPEEAPNANEIVATPKASVVQRSAPERVSPELVKSLEQSKFARPTLEKIEQVFRENPRVNRETFNNVIEEIKQKDPNFTESQARNLKQVFEQKLKSVPPEKVGSQISAAARSVLDKDSGREAAQPASNVSSLRDADRSEVVSKPTKALDDSFFKKEASADDEKKGEGEGKEKEGEKKAAAPEGGKRNETLDALKLALALQKKDGDKDKDDKDKDDDRGFNRGNNANLPPPPFGRDRDRDREDEEEAGKEDFAGPQDKKPQFNPQNLLAGLLSGSKDSNNNNNNGKKDEDKDDAPPKREKREKKEPTSSEDKDKLSKLLEEPPKEETPPPPPDDLLSAAKGGGPPPNMIPLPNIAAAAQGALGAAGAAASAMGGGMAGMMGGGGGGSSGGGSSFSGDPFGSVGMDGGSGGPSTFNYARLAEFLTGSNGGESTASTTEGTGYTSDGKRAVGINEQLRPLASDDSGVHILERFVGRLDETLCDAPEAERVALCVGIAQNAHAAKARAAAPPVDSGLAAD